jgi:rhamnosyltransferase
VSFNPDIERLRSQLESLPEAIGLVVVDNASQEPLVKALRALLLARRNTTLIENTRNVGLGAALNQGARHAMAQSPAADQLLLLDQDSVPEPGAVERLLGAYLELHAAAKDLGCVGPSLLDNTTGLQHGFHRIEGWRWTRVYPSAADSHAPIPCSNMNGSGTLVGAALFRELGGLDDSLFIDHIDTDWSFRVLQSKHTLLGIPDAVFEHCMGERGLRFWLGRWRVWPQRSPRRHYFLFRNAIWLMKRDYVPFVWKAWCVAKLILTLMVHSVVDPLRRQQVACMLEGIRAGLKRPSRQ